MINTAANFFISVSPDINTDNPFISVSFNAFFKLSQAPDIAEDSSTCSGTGGLSGEVVRSRGV
jgi:hypothetical protein